MIGGTGWPGSIPFTQISGRSFRGKAEIAPTPPRAVVDWDWEVSGGYRGLAEVARVCCWRRRRSQMKSMRRLARTTRAAMIGPTMTPTFVLECGLDEGSCVGEPGGGDELFDGEVSKAVPSGVYTVK